MYHLRETRSIGLTDQELAEAIRVSDGIKDVPRSNVTETAFRQLKGLPESDGSYGTESRGMLLFHFEGLTIDEIACACDLTSSAVKVRLHRGKRLLRDSLNNACDFYYDDNSNLQCSKRSSDNPTASQDET